MQSLGQRIKENYEYRARTKLIRRMPVIIRLDGKSFHTLTKNCQKPFDTSFQQVMEYTALYLIQEVQGCKLAYVQSDEISLLLTDYATFNTEAWFDNNIQKICSVSAGMASANFSILWSEIGIFDARAFNLPKEEVNNYFLWRQQDWAKNSVQMLARAHFSHKELQNKKIADMHEMLYTKGINWAKLDAKWKNGTTLYKYEKTIKAISSALFLDSPGFIENIIK